MGRAEQQGGGALEQLIEVSGLGLGATCERFVQVAMAHGYTVVASGPNRFRMARTYRPKWALIAAVATAVFVGLGLLFLLVKRTETGDVVVVEERTGVKLRLTGSLQAPVIDALRQSLGGGVSTMPATIASPATPLPSQPASVVATAPPPPAAAVFQPQPQRVTPVVAPVVAPVVVPVVVPAAPLAGGAAAPLLVFADGRAIQVSTGGVLGRDPSSDPALPGGQLYPIADPSLSKTHLSFGPLPHGVWVVDHHSTNGTVVSANGVTAACAPGVRVEAPFGAQVVAGDVSLMVASR
jgi:hypothetical protein